MPHPERRPPPSGDPRRKKKRRPPEAPASPQETMVDLHLQVGLYDRLVRVSAEDWLLISKHWIIEGRDIILRNLSKAGEIHVVLRGTSSGILHIRHAPSDKPLARFKVLLVRDLQDKLLERQGI